MEFPQKIQNKPTIGSSNISKGNENRISMRYVHSHVYCSIIRNSQDVETTQMHIICPSNGHKIKWWLPGDEGIRVMMFKDTNLQQVINQP